MNWKGPDIDHEAVANMTDGYSGSDLKNLCVAVAHFPIREILDKEKKVCFSDDCYSLISSLDVNCIAIIELLRTCLFLILNINVIQEKATTLAENRSLPSLHSIADVRPLSFDDFKKAYEQHLYWRLDFPNKFALFTRNWYHVGWFCLASEVAVVEEEEWVSMVKSLGMAVQFALDHEKSDAKLKFLEKHLQEVNKSVQIFRDKQQL
ncbi:putative AAA ATPase, AAA+ lid domain-containing protein [Helianthus annuus]|nr:putative AAA ATPase, AAA+ lid domain-containing protein [Helianthus annuus]